MASPEIVDVIRKEIIPLRGHGVDFAPLVDRVADKDLVLLGEASHGTQEFYRARADITRSLIVEHGFQAVAVEADWPDAARIHRYVMGESHDRDAVSALGGFERFPRWMWRNTEVLDFVGWLRSHNLLYPTQMIGFYGLDLYSLHRSIAQVIAYLDTVDRDAARQARRRYACFEHLSTDGQAYGRAAALGTIESCEERVIEQLVEMNRAQLANDAGFFGAHQNARLVKNAEQYYRMMYRGRVASWNLRDQHMTETIGILMEHVRRPKIVVWAHNSHLGDARATEMGAHGEWNVGQLVREKYGHRAALVGFTTYSGTVTAANDWDEPPQQKQVRPGIPGSYEALFHELDIERWMLLLDSPAIRKALEPPLLERAIGVVYRPDTERMSHYFRASLPRQFDAVIHFDETRALQPLDRVSSTTHEDAPDTFPSGF